MKSNTSRRIMGISVFIFASLICVYLFLHSSFFAIDKINITGLNMVSQEEVAKISGITKGNNIFQINERSIARAVTVHPLIKSATVLRHLPRTVEIKVEERKVWAIIPLQDMFLYVDEYGICMDKQVRFSMDQYPVITLEVPPTRINIGQEVNKKAVGMVKKVSEALPQEERVQISDYHYINSTGELIIYTSGGTEVKFGTMDRFEEKIGYMHQVFEIETTFDKSGKDTLEYVDLRFKGQPVVRTGLE